MTRRAGRRGRAGAGRLAAMVRGLLALVVLAGLLAGIPAVLLALGSDPLTVRLPTLDRVRDLLTSPDDGTLLIAVVQVVGWTGWGGFAVSCLVESVAAVTGWTVPVLRGLAGVQRPAAYLVAAVAAALTVPGAATAAVAAVHAPAVAAPAADPGGGHAGRGDGPTSTPAPHVGQAQRGTVQQPPGVSGWAGAGPSRQTGPPGAEHAGPSPDRRLPAVRVGRYDSLWRIAERHLGDGRRWTEIYRLNTGRPQPDGQRLTDPDLIVEGWTLLLPSDAVDASPPGPPDPADHEVAGPVVVQSGDTLSGLAERHLGTVEATGALFEANAGRQQPDGRRLTDPDRIYPGWRLILPIHATPPTPARPSPPQEPPPQPPQSAPPISPVPPSPQHPPAGPASSVPPAGPATGPTPSVPSPDRTPTGTAAPSPGARPVQHAPGWWVRLPSGSVISVGLAAVVAGLLALIRRRWRHRRIPGDPTGADLALPRLPAAAEAAERAWLAAQRRVHDPHEDNDLHADDDAGREEPDRTTGSVAGIDRLMAPADDTLAGTGGVPGRGVTVGGLPAPSLLALLGPPEARVLADRAWAGGVGLTGAGAAGAARAVLARLLTASGPIGGQLVTTDAAVRALLPAEAAEGFTAIPGVRVFPTLAGALTACEAELLGRSRRLADTDTADLAGYRQLPDAEPIAALLLVADTPDNPLLAARADAVLRLGQGRELGAVWLGTWPPATLQATADGTLLQDTAGGADDAPVVVGRTESLTAGDAADLLAGLLPAVRDALDLIDPTGLLPTAAPVSPAPDSAEPGESAVAEATGVAPGGPGSAPPAGTVLTINVFGRVRVTTADGHEVTGLRAKVRDLLALLAVHPDGLTSEQVGEALWPDAAPGRAAGRLSTTLALARRAVREAADAGDHVDLIPNVDGWYRLHPTLIDTDYRRFTAALADAAATAATPAGTEAADLGIRRRALETMADLCRGEALAGVAYAWAEPVRQRLRAQATDALAALADLLTPTDNAGRDHPAGAGDEVDSDHTDGDPAGALAALERAVEIDPYNEDLYRRMMRLHAAAGRKDAIRRTLRMLEARLVDLDTDPDPDTVTLAADLLRNPPARTESSAGPRATAERTADRGAARNSGPDRPGAGLTSTASARRRRPGSPRPEG